MDNKIELKEGSFVAFTLHAVLFSYQKAHGRIAGKGGGVAVLRLAIPYLIGMLNLAGLPELSREKSIDDNMSTYISMIRKSEYLKDAVLKQEEDSIYTFEVKGCSFAPDGHKFFHNDHICPFAILAAAVINFKTEAQISVENSEFLENGSKTTITVHQ